MPRFSCFTPMGQFRFSARPSYVDNWYKLLPRLWGPAHDFTHVGTYEEEKLYAVARMLGLAQAELEHAGNQALPNKCYDLLPLQELDYQLVPGPLDSVPTRQAALAAVMSLRAGAAAGNVWNALKTLMGAGNVLAYLPSPPTTTVYPSTPGAGPGAFKDVRVPAKLLQLVDPVVQTGTPVWCAYQALNTNFLSQTSTWSAGAAFSAATASTIAQTVQPTSVNATGFYYVCTVSGTTGTTEPVWPTQIGGTVTDNTCVWMCVAPIAAALVAGDVVVVDPGNTRQMEKVTVSAVAASVQSQTTPGYLYFQATFANSHDVGATVTTGIVPYWWSTQRLGWVVMPAAKATDPPTRVKVNALLGKLLRVVDQWAIMQPATTTSTGGTLGPVSATSPMGCVPIAAANFSNSN